MNRASLAVLALAPFENMIYVSSQQNCDVMHLLAIYGFRFDV